MSDSILSSTKKNLGLDESYTVFDPDIIMYINGVLSTLNQLGVGPVNGFAIEDSSAAWASYLGNDLRLNNIKSYITLRVRMLFDPPATSYLQDAINKQIAELEWRINVQRESTAWVDPEPQPDEIIFDGGFPGDCDDEIILDGGSP